MSKRPSEPGNSHCILDQWIVERDTYTCSKKETNCLNVHTAAKQENRSVPSPIQFVFRDGTSSVWIEEYHPFCLKRGLKLQTEQAHASTHYSLLWRLFAGPGKSSHIPTQCQSQSQSTCDLYCCIVIMQITCWTKSCWSLVTACCRSRLIASKTQDSVVRPCKCKESTGGRRVQRPGVQLGEPQNRSGQPSCMTSPQSEFPREPGSKYLAGGAILPPLP